MKERIVIENSVDVSIMKRHPNWEYSQFLIPDKQYKREQVPETFEELKKLCKGKDISAENEEIIIMSHDDTWLTFREQDGEVFLESETGLSILLGYKRTPQQMWEIIKNL